MKKKTRTISGKTDGEANDEASDEASDEANDEANDKTGDEAVPAEVFDLVFPASRSDAWAQRLDHTHGARQRRPASDKGVVRQGAGLDLQADLNDAGRQRILPLRLLRHGWRRDSSDQAVRGAGQQLHRPRRGRAGRLRKSTPRRSRCGAPSYARDGGRDHRSRARAGGSPGRSLGSIVERPS